MNNRHHLLKTKLDKFPFNEINKAPSQEINNKHKLFSQHPPLMLSSHFVGLQQSVKILGLTSAAANIPETNERLVLIKPTSENVH